MTEKKWKFWRIFLITVSVLATLKVIFFDYTLDEEYQVMMSYRQLLGDDLFKQMWEPHQTSAFLCTGLMWFYEFITGTYTGVLIFLRVATSLIQLGLAFYLYQVMKHIAGKEYAFIMGVIYYNMIPKMIQIPEFANMQLWFFTLLTLFVLEYMGVRRTENKGKILWIAAADVAMSLEVLAYPSSILLFPFFLLVFGLYKKGKPLRDCLVFTGVCGVCGLLWCAGVMLAGKLTLSEFVRNVKNILSFDLTHEVSGATAGKGLGLVLNLGTGALLLIGIYVAALLVTMLWKACTKVDEKKNYSLQVFVLASIGLSALVQLFCWMILRRGYEFPQIHLLAVLLGALLLWKQADSHKKLLAIGIVGTLVNYIAVFYISDLQLYHALPHGVLGVVFALPVIVSALENTIKENAAKWCYVFLLAFCAVVVFGKSFTFRGGRDFNMVWDVGGIMKHGIAAGVLTDYMFAYIYNCNYEDWQMYVEDGDNVLVVTNMVFSAGTTPYSFRDVNVCHYSIVDPTAYDERLAAYWELYPEKEPDVIVVDCWYGELKENPDNWIMQYIENDFGYTEVNDGRYVRFYRKSE